MDEPIDERVARLEDRVERLEALLKEVVHNLPQRPVDPRLDLDAVRAGIQQWVTDYVSLRLQQLVPETCEPVRAANPGEGPCLPGTNIRCTEDVMHRLGRIPIPFVRQMVTQRVAETARAQGVLMVDVPFFERAATF
jgi:hypothetical protein